MAPELSAFEARRRANVANNQKLLKDTKEIGASMRKAAAPAPKPAAAAPRKRRATAAAEPVQRTRTMPTRQSRRLAGANGGDDSAIKAEDVPAELREPPRQAKRARVAGDLALEKLQVEGQRWSNGEALASFVLQGAQPGVRTFTFKEEDDDNDDAERDSGGKKLKSLRKDLNELKLYEGWQPNDIKITPERVYALTFHPIQDKPLVLAGDKTGVMGIFDGSQKTPDYPEDDDDEAEDFVPPLPKIAAYTVHNRTISSIKVPAFDANSIITSSYDSSVRCLDIPTQVSSQLWAPEDEGEELAITCLDVSPEAKDIIFFSTMEGSLGRFDRRVGKGKKADIWGLTDNKIGGFSVHPLLPHLIATASLDRTLKIWDLRMTKGKPPSHHPSLLGEHASRLSVSHASWSRTGYLATSSYDDTVKIYDLSGASKWNRAGHSPLEKDPLEPTHVIPHNNQTGRWVTILKPQWQARPADGVDKLAIANMNRFVDVYGADGSQLAQLGGGEDGEITAVPAVTELHPVRNWVAGATGSGKLCLWL
ncbi:hypothetical protein DL767_006570 [Monosporascus sp. MG133]|nr:hypothetical protein DL767_006570 [Monosporascus sp. MG133]